MVLLLLLLLLGSCCWCSFFSSLNLMVQVLSVLVLGFCLCLLGRSFTLLLWYHMSKGVVVVVVFFFVFLFGFLGFVRCNFLFWVSLSLLLPLLFAGLSLPLRSFLLRARLALLQQVDDDKRREKHQE